MTGLRSDCRLQCICVYIKEMETANYKKERISITQIYLYTSPALDALSSYLLCFYTLNSAENPSTDRAHHTHIGTLCILSQTHVAQIFTKSLSP